MKLYVENFNQNPKKTKLKADAVHNEALHSQYESIPCSL